MRTRCLFIASFLCLALSLMAQSFQYEGKVVNAKQMPLEDVSVTFLREDQSIERFTFTDKKGMFSMTMASKPAFISFSCMGYERLLITEEKYHKAIVITLATADIQLKEVKVKAERVSVKNDTLTYMVSGYRMPQDKSIADVLKKIPGLEVKQGGTIYFEDKAISKLYIDGMDLMGNKYALATNNLSDKVVKKVEVLRNHQQIAALRGKNFSDQAAINLVLEEDVKLALSGTLDAGGGIRDDKKGTWDVRLLGMFFGRKHQNLTLYKSNNVGVDASEELQRQYIDNELSLPDTDPVLSLPSINLPLIDESYYLNNRDHLLATNHLMQFCKENTLRSQFHYLRNHHTQTDQSTTHYFYPEQTVSYNEQNATTVRADQWKGEMTWERNAQKRFIKNMFSGEWNKSRADQAFLQADKHMRQLTDITRKVLTDKLQLVIPINNQHIFRLTSLNRIEEMPQQLTVNPGICSEWLNNGQPYDHFQQWVKTNTLITRNTTDWQFKLFRFYIGSDFGIDYIRQRLTSSVGGFETGEPQRHAADELSNHLTLQDACLHAAPTMRFNREGLKMTLKLPVSYHLFCLEEAVDEKKMNRFTKFFAEPTLNIYYEINSKWTVQPIVTYHYQLPDIRELYTHTIFTQYREANKGSGFYTFGSWVGTLTIKFSNPLKGFFWSLTGNTVRSQHKQMPKAVQEGIVHATEMIHYKHHTSQWNLRTRISKTYAFWKLYMGLSAQYTDTDQKMMMNNQVTPYSTRSIVVSGNYALQPNRFISIEGSERFGHTTLSSPLLLTYRAYNLIDKLDVNLFPSQAWQVKCSNARYTNYRPVRSSIYFMNLSLSYQHKHYSVELTAHNMFNKQLYQQHTITSLSELLLTQTFRPREFLLKLSYTF